MKIVRALILVALAIVALLIVRKIFQNEWALTIVVYGICSVGILVASLYVLRAYLRARLATAAATRAAAAAAGATGTTGATTGATGTGTATTAGWRTLVPGEDVIWAFAGWFGLLLLPLAFESTHKSWLALVTSWPGMAIIVLFTLFGPMRHDKPGNPHRWVLAFYARWALGVIAVILIVNSALDGPLKEWYAKRSVSGFSFSGTSSEIVIAPGDKWSDERITITPGVVLKCERPIIVRYDDGGTHSDNCDGTVKNFVARYVWVQSADRHPSSVTVVR